MSLKNFNKQIVELKEWFKNELVRLLFIKESDKETISLSMLINKMFEKHQTILNQ